MAHLNLFTETATKDLEENNGLNAVICFQNLIHFGSYT